jgi:hypothetical protein
VADRVARPQGEITRGTTGPNRLRRMDRWIVHRAASVLRRYPDASIVDLGFGRSPVTTVELSDRLAERMGRRCSVVGLEIDPERVAAARRIERGAVRFQLGGFEVPVSGRIAVIRAANVLRQYDEAQVAGAWGRMSDRLVPGGLLVEGTCDELGRLGAWVTIVAGEDAAPGDRGPCGPSAGPRRTVAECEPETLTLGVDLRTLGSPSEVAQRLPKALIHRNVGGERIHDLLVALDRSWARAAPQGVFGPRQRWLAAVAEVRALGWPVADGPARWRLGELTVDWDAVAPGG